ncbi:hypothetical protein Bca52824_024563 [Brassica carinata]|uniref:Uncharacterized protein n=1 Tax=Brassica carinata TaxID=52824 RepID=A0A8X7VKJ9_BRACI|nr:hypothetical protein Bca52824_024563 [Brassica carinata]
METSQEQSFLNPSTNLAEDPILRLSSSSCSSIEAEPRPDDQSPPTQIMERSSTSTPPYRIPPRVFESTTTSTASVQWSTLSLFSIHMGNKSFTEIDYFKSGELTFPQPSSPRHETNQGMQIRAAYKARRHKRNRRFRQRLREMKG